MNEPNLRDKLTKVMAERRQAADPEKATDGGSAESAPEERNAEWKAFYEAVRSHTLKMRE